MESFPQPGLQHSLHSHPLPLLTMDLIAFVNFAVAAVGVAAAGAVAAAAVAVAVGAVGTAAVVDVAVAAETNVVVVAVAS